MLCCGYATVAATATVLYTETATANGNGETATEWWKPGISSLPLPLRIFLQFTAVTERNFLNVIFTEQRNGETATEERQRNGGNGALVVI